MEIRESSIGPGQKHRKEYSVKVMRETERYLSENDLSLDQLSVDQQKSVTEYVKEKIQIRWAIVLLILTCLTSPMFLWIGYAKPSLPDEISVVFESGKRGNAKLTEEGKTTIKQYGERCKGGFALFAGVVLLILSVAFTIEKASKIRKRRKMLEAFFPLVKPAKTTDSD